MKLRPKLPMLMMTFTLMISGSLAVACPDRIQKLRTSHLEGTDLCQLHDRYAAVVAQLKAQGVTAPDRLADLRGPRFINSKSWNLKKAAAGYSPWFIYDPAPQTWRSWENGAAMIDQLAQQIRTGSSIPKFSLDLLYALHAKSMKEHYATAGSIRKSGEVGTMTEIVDAANILQEQELVRGSGFESPLRPGQPLYTFIPTVCTEHRPAAELEIIRRTIAKYGDHFYRKLWPRTEKKFLDTDGVEKQCGYITYPPLEEVLPSLQQWEEYVNSVIEDLNTTNPKSDLLYEAANVQRWIIAIHPFDDGNGRSSRHMMDLFLQSAGLPGALLTDMDADLWTSSDAWAKEIGRGVIRAIEIAESCAQDLKRPGCQIVSLTPPEQKP